MAYQKALTLSLALEREAGLMSTTPMRFHELKATGQMPSPTGIALALLEMTQDDDATVSDIARLLQGDPALTGRLLKFVNSPMLGYRRSVASVAESVLLVGMHVVRQIVLGLSVLSTYRGGRCENFDYDRYWSRSLAIAVCAEMLCTRDHKFPPEEAFTCGLLADVGKLAFATIYPEQYGSLLRDFADLPELQFMEHERNEFLIDQRQLTCAMLEDWGLPVPYVQAVRAVGNKEAETTERSAALANNLKLAAQAADLLLSDSKHQAESMRRFIADAGIAGIPEDEIALWLESLGEHWREWSKLLDIPMNELPDFEKLGKLADSEDAEIDAPTTDKTKLRVLLIEDEALTRRILVEQLKKSSYEVMIARDGHEGLAMALEHSPHIVITDWMMPELDGLGFCKALRRTRFGERTYIIVLTAKDADPHMTEAIHAGADDYIVKPVTNRILDARLAAGARQVRLQREVEAERRRNRDSLAELAVMNRRLEQAVLTDALTGLPNRRYATRRLQQTWAAARRNKEQLACMLIDVDHFKSVNDAFGHDAGDRVLCEIATVLRGAARADDEICRIGGEEFLVICASSDSFAAQATAERLRRTVETTDFEFNPPSQRVTVSIGVAVRDAEDVDPDSIMKFADEAVYEAKHLGRNQVALSTHDTSASDDAEESSA